MCLELIVFYDNILRLLRSLSTYIYVMAGGDDREGGTGCNPFVLRVQEERLRLKLIGRARTREDEDGEND